MIHYRTIRRQPRLYRSSLRWAAILLIVVKGTTVMAQPANDGPCGAIALAVGATCVNTAGTVQNATASAVAAPGCGNGNNDVWYTVVVPASGGVTITTSAGASNPLNNPGVAIYTVGACGTAASFTEVGCNNDVSTASTQSQLTVACQTPGATLYVRLWKQSGGSTARTFNICATDPGAVVANDNPCGAVALTANLSCSYATSTNVNSCSTAGPPAPGCASYSGGDVWFSVVVPAIGTITITTNTNGTSGLTDGGMAVYSAATCAGPFTLVSCDDDSGPGLMPATTLTGQTPGATLWIRFWEFGNDNAGQFDICVTYPPPPPANDDPCGAVALTVNTTCVNTSGTNVSATATSGIPAPGCGNYSGSVDVWYAFTAPASGVAFIQTTAGSLTDAAMAVYSATACSGTFTLVSCDDDSGPGAMPYLYINTLTAGQTYYVRVWGYGTGTGTFDICVNAPATPAGSCVYLLEMFDSGGDGWGSSSVDVSLNGGAYTSYTCSGSFSIALIGLNIGDILVVNYTATGANQNENRYFLYQQAGANGVFLSGTPPTAGIVYTETADCVPPAKPPEDCEGGVTVCGSQSFNANSQNTGFRADLSSANRGCLASNERQGTWYHFSPSIGGTIGLTIAPTNAGDDYDFAVWGPTVSVSCPPPTTPLRCSYSALTGNTGIGNGAGDTSEGSGGDKWVSSMTVVAGEVYTLYVSNFSQSGLSFDLSWQLTGGASLDCTVLPVELLSLEAIPTASAIDLHWATATESNNSHFVVERSGDASEFTAIGTVQGMGTTVQQTDYRMTDLAPLHGMNYYRLRQVDLDGSVSYSYRVSAYYRETGSAPVVQPNPAADQVSVSFDAPASGELHLRLLDNSGRQVLEVPFYFEAGPATALMDLSSIEPGNYMLVMDGKGAMKGGTRIVKL